MGVWVIGLLCLGSWMAQGVETGDLVIDVRNIDREQGAIRLALYNQADLFMQDNADAWGGVQPVKRLGPYQIVVPNLPFGQYAAAVYHDVNNNGRLDTNTLGIPSEPYAFSNNARAKWRGPRFQEAVFLFTSNRQQIVLTLKSWGKQ